MRLKLALSLILTMVLSIPLYAREDRIITIDCAVRRALSFRPEIKARKKSVRAWEFSKKATHSRRWASVDLNLGAERHNNPVAVVPIKGKGKFPTFSRDIYSWELTMSFPLYEGGRISKETKLKGLGKLLEESLLRQSAQDLIANTKQVFYQVLFFKRLVKIHEKMLSVLSEQREKAFLKYRFGKIPKLDLLYFDRALSEEEADLSSARENLRLSKRILALLMGEKTTGFEIAGNIEGPEKEKIPNGDIESLISQREDVKSARLKVEKSRISLERARREYLPEIYLTSSYGHRAGSGFHNDEEVWFLGAKLKLNIFDSGVKRNTVREKILSLASEKENLRAVQLRAREEILRAISKIRIAKDEIKKYSSAEIYSREAFKRESLRYQTGAGSITDLLSAHEAWLRVKTALAKAHYDLKVAIVSLELAAGTISKGYLP